MGAEVALIVNVKTIALTCCALAGCIACGGVVTRADDPRLQTGLQALYDFSATQGKVVRDRSGKSPAIDLTIKRPQNAKRRNGSLQIVGPTIIESDSSAKRLAASIKRSQSFTLEVWITPGKEKQTGPARIVTLSKHGTDRNFTLGQDDRKYDVRFRTNKTNSNGIPSTASDSGAVQLKQTHVAYTRDRSGAASLYVNGKKQTQRKVAGNLGNWDASFRLALGDEFSGDRQWYGTYHLVALYDRALTEEQIRQNHQAGPNANAAKPTEEMLAARRAERQAQFFESKVAPILSRHCLECHDTAANEGGLDLSRKAKAFVGGESGKAIVAGDLNNSLLWTSIEDDTMPHDRDPVPDGEKATLKKWIEQGATWSVEVIDPAIYSDGRGNELWVQRLTVPEYIESVRVAVGVDIAKEAREILPPDTRADGFSNTAYSLTVDFEHVDAYSQLAQLIVNKMDVDRFASRFTKKKRLIDDDMRDLIAKMGKWVLRGPLDEHEVVTYRGITTTVASAGGNFEEAAAFVIEAMLQSPRFIYRIERQRGDGDTRILDDYELACRISYILWGAPPDEQLVRAAEAGDLYDSKGIDKQVQRLLKDPRAVARSSQFISGWLDLDRLENLRPNKERFPNWNASIAQDMRSETLAFFEEVVWKQQRPLTDLLNAQLSFMTPQLARHYGIKPKTNDNALAKYDLTATPSRGGLLTQGSLLSIGGDDASMVTRGLFVLNDLLFSEVGDPPPGLDTTPVPTSPGRTHRMIAMDRIESTSCGGCHSRFEPLAFGLEKYDGLGSFHETDEHGNELRDDGEILFPGTANPVAYDSSAELMDLLAKSDRVGQCITRKVTQFALGRPLVAADAREIREIHRRAAEAGGTYAATIAEIIKSDVVRRTRTESLP